MSKTSIPQKVQSALWARAGGRCQYRGCNADLVGDLIAGRQDGIFGFIAHIRADKLLVKKRGNAIITLLNRVLKRAGIIKVGSRRSGKTSHAWIKLLESLSDRNHEYGLNTLALYCSGKGVEPHEVTLDLWSQFVDETLNHSGFRRPRATVCRVIAASNGARSKFTDWPLPELPKFKNPRTFSIPKGDLPGSFWDDLDKYVLVSSQPPKNIFDSTAPKQLRPDTLIRYREVAWRTASAQVHAGRAPSEITSLDAMLNLHWLKEGMNWQYSRAGNKFLKDHLNMAATWISMADNYVRPPEEVTEKMRKEVFEPIERHLGAPVFSEKNMQKLDQFSSPQIVQDFLFLPYKIMARIKKKANITVKDATEMMAAVGIELLLTTMVRRKNLADLDLSKHFWPAAATNGKWKILINPNEVKNSQPLRFPMMTQTIRLIQFYLKKCRPLLVKLPTDALFLREDGTPKGKEMMANLVKTTIKRHLDLDVIGSWRVELNAGDTRT